MNKKIKFIPCDEKKLINANHKTGNLKNNSVYQPTKSNMRTIIRRAIIKEIKFLQNGIIAKEQENKLKRLDYKGLIKYGKSFKNKFLRAKHKNNSFF